MNSLTHTTHPSPTSRPKEKKLRAYTNKMIANQVSLQDGIYFDLLSIDQQLPFPHIAGTCCVLQISIDTLYNEDTTRFHFKMEFVLNFIQ
jgi:hypothetical protein